MITALSQCHPACVHTTSAAACTATPCPLQDKAGHKSGPPAGGAFGEGLGDADIAPRTAGSLRNLTVISFWTQLSLSVVSGIILFFAIQSTAVS
jgi:Protein of unknown function (DUF3611)